MAEPAYAHDPAPEAAGPPRLTIVPTAPPDVPTAAARPARSFGALLAAFVLGALVSGLSFVAGAASLPSGVLPFGGMAPETIEPPHQMGGPYASIADMTAVVRPAIVTIAAHSATADPRRGIITEEGAGSGVIFDPKGYILTNKHVIEGAQQLLVTLSDGRRFRDVQIIGVDEETDLAVVKIEAGDGPLPSAALGDSDLLRPGETVVAMGNALGRGETVVSAGVVAALERTITTSDGQMLHDLVQTDAAVNPGNSGGPLLNLAGEVVGITTAMNTRAQSVSFAVSSAAVRPVVEALMTTGKIQRPWIGVVADTVTPSLTAEYTLPTSDGVFVVGVARGGPASRAGLRPGDVIIRVGAEPVTRVRTFLEALRQRQPGDVVDLFVLRAGAEERLPVTLEIPPPQGARP